MESTHDSNKTTLSSTTMLITDLPTDIQSRIFSEIYWEERRSPSLIESMVIKALTSRESPPISYAQGTQWKDEDLQAVPNLFPHTTASVCRLWQSILSTSPRYWTRFVLDLDDPACMPSDVFGWSQSELLNVVIRSHPQKNSDNTKTHENERVSSVFKALSPYISSCKSIVFDVKYASSLPPPTPFLIDKHPHLKILKMDSEIDDVVLPIFLNIAPNATISHKVSNINHLSLYGAAFMELARIDPTWLDSPWTSRQSTTLALSHMKCCWENGSSFTMKEFLKLLVATRTIAEDFVFKHARFVGELPPDEWSNPDDPQLGFVNSLTFDEVDPNFIAAFKPYTRDTSILHLTFKNCNLPSFHTFQNLEICLIDIPDLHSLKNIMFHHDGARITFTSCPGFNDDYLDWFAANRCCPTLRFLTIKNCEQFTVAGLRAFMETRKVGHVDAAVPEGGKGRAVCPIEKLDVQSSGLRLTDEDESWFKEYTDGGYGSVSWIEDDYCLDYLLPTPSPPPGLPSLRSSLNLSSFPPVVIFR